MQISYTKKLTIQVRPYEPLSLEIGIVDILEGESYDEGILRIRNLVNSKLKEELSKIGSK